MFKFSGRSSDPQRSALTKFLDHSKEPFKRLRGLQRGLEKSSAKEAKKFYERYHSTVFYTFYACFTNTETALNSRGSKHTKTRHEAYLRDLLEIVLPALEKIMILLPEMINQRWQYHSICLIIRKLLHPENMLDLRKYAIKLLILWVHTLQENIDDSCLELFKTAIPYFPPPLTPMGLPAGSDSSTSFVSPSLSSRFGSYAIINTGNLSSSTFYVSASNTSPVHRTSPERSLCGTVGVRDIYPLALDNRSLSIEKQALELMEFMMMCVTSQVGRLQWRELHQHLRGFSFVFYQFKLHYLACLYKTFRDSAGLYSLPSTPVLTPEIVSTSSIPEDEPDYLGHKKLLTEAATDAAMATTTAVQQAWKSRMKSQRVSEMIKLDFDLSHPVYCKLKLCILQWVLRCMDKCDLLVRLNAIPSATSNSPTPHLLTEDNMPSGEELVCEMWYTSRDNVNLLLEICRQGMIASQSENKFNGEDTRNVIMLYKSWVQAENKPLFMQEEGSLLSNYSAVQLAPPPKKEDAAGDNVGDVVDTPEPSPSSVKAAADDKKEGVAATTAGDEVFPNSNSTITVDSSMVEEMFGEAKETRALEHITSTVVSASGSCVLISAWEAIAKYSTHETGPVCAGLQASLRMFIAHTAQVFLIKRQTVNQLDKLVDVCHEIILLYQDMATEWRLDPVSWEYLLSTLLQLTHHLLKDGPPKEYGSTLGSQLAPMILKTLLVSWIRASMVTKVTAKLWDHLLQVLSSLTSWKEVIIEWKNVLVLMTKVVASVVYQLDMDEMPLKKLEQQQNKNQGRGRSRSSAAEISVNRRKTFSQGLLLKTLNAGKVHPASQRSGSKRERFLSGGHISSTPPAHRALNPESKATSDSQLGDLSNEPLLDSTVSLFTDTLNEQQRTSTDELRRCSEPTTTLDHLPLTQTLSAPSSSKSPSPLLTQSPLASSSVTDNKSSNNIIITADTVLTPPSAVRSNLILANENVQLSTENIHEQSPVNSPQTLENVNLPPQFKPKLHSIPKAYSVDDSKSRLLEVTNGQLLRDSFSSDILPDRTGSIKIRRLRDSCRRQPNVILEETRSSSDPPEGDDNSLNETIDEYEDWTDPGWTLVSACTIWKRMFGVLGNISHIKSPAILAETVKCIEEVWKKLNEIDRNLGVSEDNSHTPFRPELLPPLLLFAPWLFQVCCLPVEYIPARHSACRLLCCMFLRHTHYPQPTTQHLQHFYWLLNSALQSGNDMQQVAVKHGSHLFVHVLPGSTLLIPACVQACKDILTAHKSQSPRVEALTLLASLHLHPELYRVGEGDSIKDKMVEILFQAAKTEPDQQPRCLALFQLGLLVFSDFINCKVSSHLRQGIDILVGTLQFPDLAILLAAVDVITLLTSVAPQMKQTLPDMPTYVIQQLCLAISTFLNYNTDSHKQALVALMLCLRDWMMVLPLSKMRQADQPDTTELLRMVFRVLQSALFPHDSRQQVLAKLSAVVVPPQVSILGLGPTNSATPGHNRQVPLTASHQMSSASREGGIDPVTTAAKSVLSHLLSLLGHFPFHCGAAQIGSTVAEYHDSPSLQYLEDLSTEIFISPRVQFFIYNDSTIISCVEIPTKASGLPGSALVGHLECRIIVRDITGKYVWDSAILHGLQSDSDPLLSTVHLGTDSSIMLESAASASLDETDSFSIPLPAQVDISKPLALPTWQAHHNSRGSDILDELLQYVEESSPECTSHVGVGLNSPAPCSDPELVNREDNILECLEKEMLTETEQHETTKSLPTMSCNVAERPGHVTASFAYHYCKLIMSHFGMFSWEQRSHMNLLEKTDQLIRELKNLDARNTQCRQTYKIAVMYVACGQEDRESILKNTSGSRDFEDFVAGLGWEVDLATHQGYMGGLEFKSKSSPGATAPYFATSSEEVFFHVSTRMSVTDDLSHKIRHIGNDEVHIVWSTHWRDYRRSIFKTQFGDILIVIYPLPNHLFRIHIIKKQDVPQFGPLFDGAIVDHVSLPILVRATAINAIRSKRESRDIHMAYRGRYEDRAQFIKSMVKKLKQQQCFEDFAMHCMHPMELVTSPSHVSTRENTTSHISTSSSTPVPQVGVSPPSASVIHPQSRSPRMMTKALSSDAHISPSNTLNTPDPGGRPRAHTYTCKKEAMEKINKKDLHHSLPQGLWSYGRNSPTTTPTQDKQQHTPTAQQPVQSSESTNQATL